MREDWSDLADFDAGADHESDRDRDGDAHRDLTRDDVRDRHALRRVAGLATELTDVTEVEYRQLRLERVVLVGVWTSGTAEDAANSMAELASLADTAGSQVLEAVIQRRSKPDAATYIGSGKAADLRDIVVAVGADTVVCDGELSPGQLRQLEEIVKVKVIDRTALILDIFAQHASSHEGKAQVELAQLAYLLPRLRGWGEAMSRSGGGIGTRMGSGETKIETDRRRIRRRMAKLRTEIERRRGTRETMRASRRRNEVPGVAIVGYTNAGKSSLLNVLTGSDAMVEDALFATLDPLVRRMRTPDGRTVTLTDTVGFVRHLPHQLVDAFRSTLEEVASADLLLHVADASHVDPEGQVAAVREVLRGVGGDVVSELLVFNKCDDADPLTVARLQRTQPGAVIVSARTGFGIERLRDRIMEELPAPAVTIHALVPYGRGDLVSRVHEQGELVRVEHRETGTEIWARVSQALADDLSPFVAG